MSFQQGLSGLNASSRNLEVIGNNIANANTVGAKSSRAEFADIYSTSFAGGTSNSPGIGVNPGFVAQQFTQGSISTTGNTTDLAINGGGFFQTSNGTGPIQYTRNGQFKLDKDGHLVNNQGYQLMGYTANSTGQVLPGVASPIQLPTAGIDPIASSSSLVEANLDSRVQSTATVAPAAPGANVPADQWIDISDPKTYNNATSTTVYDQQGQPITMTYYFQKVNSDEWNVYATANGQSVNVDPGTGTPESNHRLRPIATVDFPPNGGNPISPSTGTVTSYQAVTDIGSLTPPYTVGTAPTPIAPAATDGVVTFATGIPVVTLATGGFSKAIPTFSLSLGSMTQNGASFAVTRSTTDGNAPGQLSGLTIESDGTLTTRYSNGQTKTAGQIELATFRNPNGLQPVGGNAWVSTSAAGDPVRNVPGEGNLGLLQSGALEDSNVDLTAELVNMMTAQRVYQANAQTIKTQDQIMSTLVNLR